LNWMELILLPDDMKLQIHPSQFRELERN